jgi:predicted metalloendopeptidase
VTTDEDKMDDYKLSWRFDDPHPMFRNRANTILSMTDDFYRVYNIKETDAMYVAPEDRVTLWN